jgi:hypothetical protein
MVTVTWLALQCGGTELYYRSREALLSSCLPMTIRARAGWQCSSAWLCCVCIQQRNRFLTNTVCCAQDKLCLLYVVTNITLEKVLAIKPSQH